MFGCNAAQEVAPRGARCKRLGGSSTTCSHLLSCCDQSRSELVADDSSLSAKAGSRLRPSAEPASTTVLCKTLRRLAAQLASRWLARLRSNVLALLGPAGSAFGPLVGTGMAMCATRQ